MSSLYVRDTILDFIKTNHPTEKVVEMEIDYEELDDFLPLHGINRGDPWLGVQFLPSEEIPIDILSNNVQGKYRESGIIFLHVVERSHFQCHRTILARAEELRDSFRGRRVGNVVVRSVNPTVFGAGASLSFEGGLTSGTIQIVFESDIIL